MGSQGIVSGNGPAPGHSSPAAATLVLLAQRLSIRLTIGVKVLFAALLPRGPHFRRRDVPIGPALFRDRTQVLTEIFHRRPTEEPIGMIPSSRAMLDSSSGRASVLLINSASNSYCLRLNRTTYQNKKCRTIFRLVNGLISSLASPV
jgi:hypothetical protein